MRILKSYQNTLPFAFLSFIGLMLLTVHLQAQEMKQPKAERRYSFKTQTLAVNDSVKIGYYEKGEGKTLLMVHGLGGYMKNWEQNIDALSEEYHCVVIDLPGYWSSAVKEAWQSDDYMEFFARQLIAFIQQKELEEPVLMGHSMGGQVAIVAALKAPELFSKLILAAPAGIETFRPQQAAMLKQISQPEVMMKQEEPAIRQAFAINFYQQPEGLEAMIQDRLWLKETPYFKSYCQIVSNGVKGMLNHPVRENLAQLEVPTLIIYGTEDRLIPNKYLHPDLSTKAIAQAAADEIPNAELVLIPEAGHLLQYERPEAFNQAVMDYLESGQKIMKANTRH